MELRVIKFSNGMDVIADLGDQPAGGTVTIGGVLLGDVVVLKKPRILMMQQTQNGVQVGLAPFNIEDENDTIKIEVMLDKIMSVFKLPVGSKLVNSYLQTTTSIALNTGSNMPLGGGKFVAN